MNLILFDDKHFSDLLPFTFTRPVAEIRVGIFTIREKWEMLLNKKAGHYTRPHLASLFPAPAEGMALYINGAVIPDDDLTLAAGKLQPNEMIMQDDRIIMFCSEISPLDLLESNLSSGFKSAAFNGKVTLLKYAWDIFSLNDQEIRKDFSLITRDRISAQLSVTNTVINKQQVFIEESAVVECSFINASTGPVYIAKGAEVMEGCMIRGPFALGEQAVLKMGAKIYGATTIGQGCKAGGEVSNSVMFANSNKAHDGFLGNSVIGEWCNLGADSNNSNLKNNYSEVSVWNYSRNQYIKTGLTFCGLFMGDHSKCSINSMFNTGTTAGVSANIFGAGFPDKYIPSFTWGGTGESEVFILDKAIDLIKKVMARRGREMGDAEKKMITHLYMEQLKPLPGTEDL